MPEAVTIPDYLIERMLVAAFNYREHLDPIYVAEVWQDDPVRIEQCLNRLVARGMAEVIGDITLTKWHGDERQVFNIYRRPR